MNVSAYLTKIKNTNSLWVDSDQARLEADSQGLSSVVPGYIPGQQITGEATGPGGWRGFLRPQLLEMLRYVDVFTNVLDTSKR